MRPRTPGLCPRHAGMPRAAAAVASIVLVLLAPAIAFAHAVVVPRQSTPGAYEKYVLRVPNEKAVATTRVEIRFPETVRVVSFAEVSGWRLETHADSAGNVTTAIWTGSLAPQRFIEFPFVAVNPKNDGLIAWPTFQDYADGERVEWTGPEGSRTPASTTTIAAAAGVAADRGATPAWTGAALVLSLLSLGLALRRPASARDGA